MSGNIDEAIANIGPEDHVLAVWFVGFETSDEPGEPCDIMAVLWRSHADARYVFTVRTRYDAKTDDPRDDRKVAHHRSLPPMLAGKSASDFCDSFLRGLIDKLPITVERPLTRVTIGGDVHVMLRKLRGRSWVHIRRETRGQA